MRRSFVVHSSPDEEGEEHQQVQENNQNPQTPTPENPNPNSDLPLEVSDDDFVDAFDNISPPPPAAPAHAIDDYLRPLGLRLRHDWLDACLAALSTSLPGFGNLDVASKAKLCFSRFLFSDMNHIGAAVLPPDVHVMHCAELAGPFVLQVDEIVNISAPLRERYHDASAGLKRCLKLSLTDGAQRVFGMEYRPIKDLQVLNPAGLKICIRNVHIRRGLLMLVPEVVEVLGGLVEELDAARKRLVEEVNKPPRGKRRRNEEVLSLVTRAQRAAWPANIVSDSSETNAFNIVSGSAEMTISRPHGLNISHPSGHGVEAMEGIASTSETTVYRGVRTSSFASGVESSGASVLKREERTNRDAGVESMEEIAPISQTTVFRGATTSSSASVIESSGASIGGPGERTKDGLSSSGTRVDVEAITCANIDLDSTRLDLPNSDAGGSVEGLAMPSSRLDVASNRSTVSDANVGGNTKVGKVDHPLILSGDKETPFTYLACLLAKWTASKDHAPFVRGKIKCFLTGVEHFHFKQRSKYELHVYVDDGSLISEVLIDHNVVQNGIGHSPLDVSAALSSRDKKVVANMKEIMKRYQHFLAHFEGTIFVEMSNQYPLPVALEMNQGCPPSDALLLLSRLRGFTAQSPQQIHSTPIDISP